MKVRYSPRAVADLRKVSLGTRVFGEVVSAAVEVRIREVVARIAQAPESARRLIGRPAVRVVPLVQNVQGDSASVGIFDFQGAGTISNNNVAETHDAIAGE